MEKYIVYKKHTLAVLLTDRYREAGCALPGFEYAQILRGSVLRGADVTDGVLVFQSGEKTVRPATAQDFEKFRVVAPRISN